MDSMRTFEFGAFTRKEESAGQHQFNGVPTPQGGGGTPNNNNNSFPGTPSAGINPIQQQQLPSSSSSIPKLLLEGQQPLDKKYLYSTSTVRFVGYAQTSETFVEGKPGGVNSDLLDAATARGGYDPAEAVARANKVWKERTFVVEPSKTGWTLHILKAKLGGDTSIKHSIQLSEVSNIDIMTSQQPGRKFQVHARTTADTQAKTHFMLDFQSYIAIAIGKQNLEITCRTPEAVVRNYTFLVNCLQATAILCRHSAELVAAEKELDKQPVSVHLRTIVNEVTGATAPIKFDCTFSLSTKPQEPHVQLRGEAVIPAALFDLAAAATASSSSASPNNFSNNNNNNNGGSFGAASGTPSFANDGFGSPTNNTANTNNINSAKLLGVKAGGNIKVRGKFRILLHPLNLNPPATEEGLRVIVQSDEDHMVPVELRPVPGKTRAELVDVQRLRRALVTIIQSMMEMGSAMSGPRLAMETANQTGQQPANNNNNNSNNSSSMQQQQQQQQFPGSPMMASNNNNNNNMNNSNMAPGSPKMMNNTQSNSNNNNNNATSMFPSSGGIGANFANNNNNNRSSNSPSSPLRGSNNNNNNNSNNFNNNNNQQQNQLPMVPGRVANSSNSNNPNNWNVLNSASRMAFGTGYGHNQGNMNFRGNSVEQLESGTRLRLESTFLELLRTLSFASMPSRGMGMRMSGGGGGGVASSSSSSPHRLASQQNTSINNYYPAGSSPSAFDHPLATSPRFMHQQSMQRNGSVPIAVTQIANSASQYYSSPTSPSNNNYNNNQQQQYRVVVDPATGKDLIRGNYDENNNHGTSNNFVWDFRHTNTWPMMMPGDDVQDFRLHLARILKHRAGKDLKQGTSTNNNNNNNVAANNNNSNNNNNMNSSPVGSPRR